MSKTEFPKYINISKKEFEKAKPEDTHYKDMNVWSGLYDAFDDYVNYVREDASHRWHDVMVELPEENTLVLVTSLEHTEAEDEVDFKAIAALERQKNGELKWKVYSDNEVGDYEEEMAPHIVAWMDIDFKYSEL